MLKSHPHADHSEGQQGVLFGTVNGHTTSGGIFLGGDNWSKLFRHRRQTILQFVAGGNFPIIIAERREEQALIQEENKDKWVEVSLPGYQAMPSLRFSGFNQTQSLWAQLAIGFHIHLEGKYSDAATGKGGYPHLEPEVLLRLVFQWPLEPNA